MPRSIRRAGFTLRSPEVLSSIQRRFIERSPMWRVDVTACGVISLRDARGADPLTELDPMVRLKNFALASQAPTLKEATLLAVKRIESIHGGWERDERLCALLWTAVYGTAPLSADISKLRQELPLHNGEVDEAA